MRKNAAVALGVERPAGVSEVYAMTGAGVTLGVVADSFDDLGGAPVVVAAGELARAGFEPADTAADTLWTISGGGCWSVIADWSADWSNVPAAIDPAMRGDHLGAFMAPGTTIKNTAGNAAQLLAAGSGATATLAIQAGGSLAAGSFTVGNITADGLLVGNNAVLAITGGTLTIAFAHHANIDSVVLCGGGATADNFAQNAGSFTLGGRCVLGTANAAPVPGGLTSVISGITATANFIDRPSLAGSAGQTPGEIASDPAGAVGMFDGAAKSANLVLDPDAVYPAFVVTEESGTGTLITAAGYCPGTRIRTPAGDVPIELLALGDCVVTAFRMSRAIRWLGRRDYPAGAPSFIAPSFIVPVRIAAGAIEDGVPARDLWLSPEQAIYIDRVLVPVAALVNGVSVTQPLPAAPVSYIQLELGTHDLLLAEDLPAESFIATDGSPALFDNAYIPGPPARSCARRVEEGPELAAIRRRLAARAGLSGDGTVRDSGVHLLADGETVAPDALADGIARFRLPRRPGTLRLRSRSAVPAHLDIGTDRRRLGVMVHGLRFETAEGAIDVPAADKLLSAGFYPPEGRSRWTAGDAGIPVPRRRGALTVNVHMTPLPAYPG